MSCSRARSFNAFRFLDLPTEIRLLVYEVLTKARTHSKLDIAIACPPLRFPFREDKRDRAQVTLVYFWSPTAVLLTCRRIYNEVKARFRRSSQHGVQAASECVVVNKSDCCPQLIVHLEDNETTRLDNGLKAAQYLIESVVTATRHNSYCSLEAVLYWLPAPFKSIPAARTWARQAVWHRSGAHSDNKTFSIGIDVSNATRSRFRNHRVFYTVHLADRCKELEKYLECIRRREGESTTFNIFLLPESYDFQREIQLPWRVEAALKFSKDGGVKQYRLAQSDWLERWSKS